MEINEPPTKKIKSGQELSFVELISECYDLKFKNTHKTDEEEEHLSQGIQRIREILEQTVSSSEVSLGTTRTCAKINWGKCLGLLLEDGPRATDAIKILTERLSTGGGLL